MHTLSGLIGQSGDRDITIKPSALFHPCSISEGYSRRLTLDVTFLSLMNGSSVVGVSSGESTLVIDEAQSSRVTAAALIEP